MKSNILFGMTLAMSAGFVACSSDDNFDENYGKEAIAFSSYVNNCPSITAKTRAVGEITAFTSKTQIAMSISSETKTTGVADATKKAINTTANVEAKTGSEDRTKVTFTNDEKRYWDDLWGREAQLTVYAAGVEGKTIDQVKSAANKNNIDLGTDNKIDWTLSTTQTATTYGLEDLLISNNVKKTSDDNDQRLKYNNGFPTGNLVFTHATTKITLNLIKGDGFGDGEFTNPTVTYKGFYNKAKYDVTNGSVDVSGQTTTDITPIKPAAATTTTDSKTMFTYNALVVPSRNWDAGTASKVFTIETDDNTYDVYTSDFNSSSSLANKLSGQMLAGNQYIFNVTINMSGIKVTASLINWIPNNTALTPIIVTKGDIGNNFDKDEITKFDLYRSMAVGSGYGNKECTCTGNKDDGFTMDKQIYWPNHEDAYFFRAISAYGEDGNLVSTFPTYTKGAVADGVQPEYIAVSTCKTVGSEKVKDGMDVVVGAPYEKNADGGVGTLTPAKKATDGNINFTFMHVMSQVYVQLKTTTGAEKVDLTGAKVEILNSYTNGKVNASDNKISATGDKTDGYSLGDDLDGTDGTGKVKLPGATEATSGTNVYRGYTVPQSLGSGTDKVQIKVTTQDGNTYFVDASTTDITSWVSGNQYLYNLTLKKTGIVLTASLVDWKTGKVIDLGVKL